MNCIKSLAFILLISIHSCSGKKQQVIEKLTDVNIELKERIEELESENTDLKDELESLNEYVERYKELYELAVKNFNDLLNSIEEIDRLNNEIRNSNTSISQNYSQKQYNNFTKRLFTEVSNNIETTYYDNGTVVKPTLNNLHLFLSYNFETFKLKMKQYKYSLPTDGTYYINDEANCCAGIVKEYNSVTMIFTKPIDNNLESDLNSNNIPFSYENGFKEYKYELDNLMYSISFRSSNNGFSVIIRQI